MGIIRLAARIVFILCLPVLFFSASLAWAFNSQWLLEYGFEKYNVSQTTGLPETELEKISRSWTEYLNSGDEYWHVAVDTGGGTIELFTPEEQVHFRDVKQLVWLDYRAMLASLLIVLAYASVSIFRDRGKYRRQVALDVIQGSVASLLLILILGAASLLDFDRLFLQFHYLAFTNAYWSAEGYMLLLFPGGFWFDAALIAIGFMAGLAVLAGFLAILYLKVFRRQRPVP